MAGQETVKHARDGVLTAQDDASNLRHLVSLLSEQKHLIARSAFYIGSLYVPLAQLRQEERDLSEVREAGLTQFPLFIRHHQGLSDLEHKR